VGGTHLHHFNPFRDWQRRLRPNEPTHPEVLSWNATKDFTDVFSEEAFTHLPLIRLWDHAIELHPDTKLPRARGRTLPLSPAEQKELDECQGMSETGNVSCPSAHGTPTDLRNRCSRGQVLLNALSRKCYMHTLQYVHRGTLP